jgi:nucleoside-diphosphate-sugar epimerase
VRVFITGITGFVGSELAQGLRSEGHEVRGSSTRGSGARASSGVVVHRLGEPIDPAWLAGVDVLVHAAWDLAPTSGSRNVAGSVSWREAAAASGSHAVFISSYSAYADFPTAYGRDKASAEAAFTGSAASVVRPALVVGRGGLFARLVARVRRGRILPLPDGGRHDVDLIDVSDLCQALCALVSQRRPGSYDLSAGRLSLRQLCGGIARALGHGPPLVVPVPMTPVARALEVLARRGIALGVGERLLGYVENGKRLRRSSLAEILTRMPTGPMASVLARAPLAG